jgi:hypothetical protein
MVTVAGLKRRVDTAATEIRYAWRAGLLGRQVERPPIVIAGCGHSGTTLLLSILDAHSAIFGVPYEAKLGKSEGEEFDRVIALHDRDVVSNGVRCLESLIDRQGGVRCCSVGDLAENCVLEKAKPDPVNRSE